MLTPVYLNAFKRDLQKVQKRHWKTETLKHIIDLLINEIPLPPQSKNHKLVGNWKGRWECHIAPDWLLIYRLEEQCVIFERTGTHADLF